MESQTRPAEATADIVLDLYRRYGNADYIGEPVSQMEHMIQCAMIAEEEGFDDEVVLAALFHDIGHFCEHFMQVEQMASYGVVDHEGLGADFLEELGFSDKIVSLVRNHVAAKRYLTFSSPDYYNNLSEASKETLKFQGGMMSPEEAQEFESDPLSLMYTRLRSWDEKAKLQDIPLQPLDLYRSKIIAHLINQK